MVGIGNKPWSALGRAFENPWENPWKEHWKTWMVGGFVVSGVVRYL